MESPTRPILSPSKALNPVSPERMNQQTIPPSPSLPSDLLTLHHKRTRGVSEVQAKVAFLNGLSRGGNTANSASNNAALQRAMLGREEAESALTTAQEDLSEAQTRERRISERLESLLEELHGTKERQAHERSIFEKEIRKARKEAFRAGSTLVKLQEELKHSKSDIRALKEELGAEREAKDKAKQEAFERAYALAGLTEELEVLKEKFRALETDNHSSTLEVRAHEIRRENFGRLSIAEGDLAFLATPRRAKRAATGSVLSPAPAREEDHAEATPPKRPRLSDCAPKAESEKVTSEKAAELDEDMLEEIREELIFERRRRVAAEDMVHFLNIECQFERCSCRLAESQGRRYIYDAEYYNKFQKPQIEAEAKARAEQASIQKASVHQVLPHPASTPEASPPPPPPPVHRSPVHQATTQVRSPQHSVHQEETESSRTPSAAPPVPVHQHTAPTMKAEPTDLPKMQMPEEPLVTFSPVTGTFTAFPSPLRDNVRPLRLDFFDKPDRAEPRPDVHAGHADASASPDLGIDSFTPSGEPAPTRMPRPTPSDGAAECPRVPLSVEARPSRRVEREPYGYRQPINPPKRAPSRQEPQSQRTSHPGVPDTPIDREQALAQIRARRGRTHSKQRSVSASEPGLAARASAGSNPTSARGPRRVPNPSLRADSRTEKELGERRDMSAPVRMFRR
ncbi:hypothetical protein DTO013E5_8207 [Penicillium roqueforti]|uniref:Uncharacterized protein n=1 Tax=Penicillium roqueforti (strain FM164) TaxID=1365484 RepID=W6QME6_PENRF|nr:uncharacterized protein LCP9604111_3902 [Penicillium roqueforti]CDM38043.1 unnamed protein product [Penicillium roqueforti FM164]KAF9249802.1 hypothetical protein LCP9604111_3902 [Penicillium roqueforti]KAI1830425.1 hypothetical protein CBS147337_8699 [Penicillium roqueforti]KAI2673640.1 hypothetical protein CBS147355_7399 [Penicillium roqueforti]KAI2684976.1 hypothetical protein LCP963914a_5068 [Penicillium roqueforti]